MLTYEASVIYLPHLDRRAWLYFDPVFFLDIQGHLSGWGNHIEKFSHLNRSVHTRAFFKDLCRWFLDNLL